jgi:type I restriction enzyme S subunit
MMTATKNRKPFYNTEIPSDWDVKELSQICKVNQGLQIPIEDRLKVYEPNSKVYITIQYLNNGKDIEYIKNYNQSVCCSESDILMTRTGNTGIVVSGVSGVFHNNFFKINFNKEDVDPIFLKAYLRANKTQHEILVKAGTSTIPDLNHKDFYKIKIPLPPLPEQKAIAQILSTWDEAIHKTEQLIAQKEQRKKWLMQNLLTGKKRLKGFDGEWKEKKLSDLFDRVTRKNSEGNKTVVTISAQRGFVRQTDFFNKNIASEITDNYFLVERGEFCYNKSYSNGYPWGATKRLNDFDKAVVTTLYICFGVKDENKTNPEFFEQYFGANHLDKGLTKIAHEGGRAHGLLNVTPSDFFSLKVIVPSIEEQTAIAQVLQAADKEIQLLKMKCDKLKEQKKGLMQVLLTGKVRLKIN